MDTSTKRILFVIFVFIPNKVMEEPYRFRKEVFKDRRIQAGISQQDLAFEIDSCVSVISKLETGATKFPSVETLMKLCIKLHSDINDFLEY